MRIKITQKDWNAIYSLIDSLENWADQFHGPYKRDYEHFNNKTIERVNKQLNADVSRGTSTRIRDIKTTK